MVPIKCVTMHDEHPDLMRRELDQVARTAHHGMGYTWASELLPEHFEPSARSIFGYQPRSRGWLRRKAAAAAAGKIEGNAQTDLVNSGALKRALLRAKHMVRAYPSRVTVDLVGTSYFIARPRRAGAPNLHREVKAMSPRHDRLVGQAGDRGFEAALKMVRASRRARKVTKTT